MHNVKDKENITIDFITKVIKKNLAEKVILSIFNETLQPYLVINKEYIYQVCDLLKNNPDMQFNYLSCLTGVDYRDVDARFELVYHLYSTFHKNSLVIKVTENIGDTFDMSFASVTNIWKAADWYEREIFDLFGVKFTNHPNLKRILLPDDWQGYPLRKDYKAAYDWHGMPIEYDRDDL
ncbi:MAG: NADH-quinone oxidoreductase subunit C [Solitalea-like symbiont of Acarus siro]